MDIVQVKKVNKHNFPQTPQTELRTLWSVEEWTSAHANSLKRVPFYRNYSRVAIRIMTSLFCEFVGHLEMFWSAVKNIIYDMADRGVHQEIKWI